MMASLSPSLLAETARAPAQTHLAPRHSIRCFARSLALHRVDKLTPPAAARAPSFAENGYEAADAALARRRALFLLGGGGSGGGADGSSSSSSSSPPQRRVPPNRGDAPLLRIWRVGIDEPRLLKALEGAGFAGRVLVAPSASGCDAVLAVARKAAGGRRRVDLAAARSAARNARAAFVLLRATTPRAVFQALAPMIARREVFGAGEDDDDEEEEDDERVAAAVERLRRAAPALLRSDDGGDNDNNNGSADGDEDVGFTRVPTLRAVMAAASGARPASSSTPPPNAAAASSALRLLELLARADAARRPRRGARLASTTERASRRPLLSPPRVARLPEPAWLWLGTAGAAADRDGEVEEESAARSAGGGGAGGGDDDNGRAAMVPRNRDARADAAFRVTRDDGGPLQPGAPGDAKRRKQAAEERRRRSGKGGW